MRRSSTSFAVLAISALSVLAGNSVVLGGNGKKDGGFNFGGQSGINFSKGGFNVGLGGPSHGNRGNGNRNRNNQGCNNGGYNGGYNNNGPVFGGQALEPFHSSYFVQPGDSFYEVSLKEYGTSAAATSIAQFNRLPSNAALVPGQRLLLPSISTNGRLTQSRAPAPEQGFPFQAPASTPTNKFTQTGTTTTAPSTTTDSEPLPKFTTGSVLTLEGQEFGSDEGVARLRVGGVAFPVEVLEWTASVAKVRLPNLDAPNATRVELEVVRADGTLASSNAIELTNGTASSLAAKN